MHPRPCCANAADPDVNLGALPSHGLVHSRLEESKCVTFLAKIRRLHWQALSEKSNRFTFADKLTRVRQRVGMVFQQFNLFPHMTAIENVMEGLRTVRGIARDKARELAGAQLARVGLADKAEVYPARLSGGQKQRVATARALAMEPELLLFDEPTSALDPELVGEVLSVIRALAQEGRTMLLATHEVGFAYHFASRVLFIADGVIHESGTPDEVLKHPRQARTQAFLASHNEFSF